MQKPLKKFETTLNQATIIIATEMMQGLTLHILKYCLINFSLGLVFVCDSGFTTLQ